MSDLQSDYLLKYNTGLQLITIRHYNDEVVADHIRDKKVFLEQKSRSTIQLLVKSSLDSGVKETPGL
jgi:aspartate kinase